MDYGDDINNLTKPYGFQVHEKVDHLKIKSILKLGSKDTFGVVLIGSIGLMVATIALLNQEGFWVTLFVVMLGLFAVVMCILSLAKQSTDYLIISKDKIISRNSLKKRVFPISSDITIKMTSFNEVVNKQRNVSARYKEIWLYQDKEEFRLFDYHGAIQESYELDLLGKIVMGRINRVMSFNAAMENV